jgi:hypothetical protein
VSIAGLSPSEPPTTSAAPNPNATKTSAKPTTTKPTSKPPSSGANGGNGGNGNGTGSGTNGNASNTAFTIHSGAYPNVGGGPQLFSYVVPSGPNYRVVSVVLRNPAGDTGQVELRHGQVVLATVNLAEVRGDFTFHLADPPLVAPGERVTMAVTCTNKRDACTPTGSFTAALVH